MWYEPLNVWDRFYAFPTTLLGRKNPRFTHWLPDQPTQPTTAPEEGAKEPWLSEAGYPIARMKEKRGIPPTPRPAVREGDGERNGFRWIPVSERVPAKHDYPVLVLDTKGDEYSQSTREMGMPSIVFHEAWFEPENLKSNGIAYWFSPRYPALPASPQSVKETGK